MWRSFATYSKTRWRLLVALALLMVWARAGTEVVGERTFASVLGAVEHATGLTPTKAAWEPSRGRLADLLHGRPLVWTGRSGPGAPQDVYRTLVRVAPDGAPLSVRRTYNLTNTELADEQGLLVRGTLIAFATVAFDHVQSVTVLDSRGVYRTRSSESRLDAVTHRLELGVRSLLETGTARGLGRTDIEFGKPTASLQLELTPETLTLAAGPHSWRLKAGDFGLEPEAHAPSAQDADAQFSSLPRISHPKPALHWMADVGRTLLGTGPIAWLEGRAFNTLDRLRRLSYGLGGAHDEPSDEGPAGAPSPGVKDESESPSSSELSSAPETWPPPAISSPWKTPRADEGLWKPVDLPFLARFPGSEGTPPYFYRTFVRPDRERPYADVLLVAMDMRRLELGMEGGYEDPRPSAGSPGTGHVPQDPRVYRRIVATFNGAFKTGHGGYGMVVNRRVLVPPAPGAATVRVDRSGAVGLGTWPRSTSSPPNDGHSEIPKDILSLRQNLDPLIEGSAINPKKRKVWGSQLYGQGVAAERSALCVTEAGHLVYAWAEEVSGEILAEALRMAGCQYGIHLDMNPGHCAFVFTNILDFARVEANTEVLDHRMRINPTRYIRWSPKDFFYVALRDPIPRTRDVQWEPDNGPQTDPPWLPSIFRSVQAVGALKIDVHRFEAGRLTWAVQAGSGEPSPTRSPQRPEPSELGHLVASLHVGHSTPAARHGLALGRHQAVPLDPALPTLVLPRNDSPRLEAPGTPLTPSADESLIQLPLLARDGELSPRAREPGALRSRGALCLDEQGNLLVSQVTHDSSAPAARALLQLGCDLVVEMDRGSHHPPSLERTSEIPLRPETTVLYAVGRPLEPRAYWWRP